MRLSSVLTARPPRLPARVIFLPFVALALAVPFPALAGAGRHAERDLRAFVPPQLLESAQAEPEAVFDVIVQGKRGTTTARVARDVSEAVTAVGGKARGTKKRFASISGVAAQLTGDQIVGLAGKKSVLSITPDVRMKLANYSSKQQWPYVSGVARFWASATNGSLRAPTIAVVDSGIEADRSDFGGRVVAEVKMTALQPNSPGDGRGHGTFVASIAAGGAQSYSGGAPNARIVSIDVMDDLGMAMTSDVIAAADWILEHKDAYGIRIANFSLHSSQPSTFMFDPLDKAVEQLWFNGIVVVAAAGNYGVSGQASRVLFAPGNDPFVITVGAADIAGSTSVNNDIAAPWSTYGYTLDGFAKPELGAPGRYMVGAVPAASTLAQERPDRIVAPGYLQMSGTSFAAPVVAGAAAYLLAKNPGWTPDQVKGALMLAAKPAPSAAAFSLGVGEVDAARAADVVNPPNPNRALNEFVVTKLAVDPVTGTASWAKVFDSASWARYAESDASWARSSWADASWSSASWAKASWEDASWARSSWESASWAKLSDADASWSSASVPGASWAKLSLSDASWASNAEEDTTSLGGYWMTPEELAQAEAEIGMTSTPPASGVAAR